MEDVGAGDEDGWVYDTSCVAFYKQLTTLLRKKTQWFAERFAGAVFGGSAQSECDKRASLWVKPLRDHFLEKILPMYLVHLKMSIFWKFKLSLEVERSFHKNFEKLKKESERWLEEIHAAVACVACVQ